MRRQRPSCGATTSTRWHARTWARSTKKGFPLRPADGPAAFAGWDRAVVMTGADFEYGRERERRCSGPRYRTNARSTP
jgi:hypothetical protein